jgi:hypothetical protein
MAVSVIVPECPRITRAGTTLDSCEGVSGRPAGITLKEKSCPDDKITLDDGKNFKDVTTLRCDLQITFDLVTFTRSGTMEEGGTASEDVG